MKGVWKEMKFTKSKKIIFTVALGITILMSSMAGTYAYVKSNSVQVKNTFRTGSIRTEIDEHTDPSQNLKQVRIVNTGKNDCLVRVRVTISPENAAKITDFQTEHWEKKGEFWYYKGILKAAETNTFYATDYLFEHYKVADGWTEDFEITVSEESVQAVVYTKDGKKLSAYNADGSYRGDMAEQIWNAYDAGKLAE